MKGIMHSNAFQSLDADYLESLARNVGVDISAISGSSEKVEDQVVQSRCHVGNVVPNRSVAVDLEIPERIVLMDLL
jgi:hypothetical protein